MKHTFIYFLSTITTLTLTTLSVSAQKLPNKQEKSVWAPSNVKIDAKQEEWGSTYEAHNNATGLYYTIANDGENLYLNAYLTDLGSIYFKTMSGGINFVIKAANQTASVRYPAFSYKELPSFNLPQRGQALTSEVEDSVVIANNKKLSLRAKDIEVKGISSVDTLISVYNDNGIKTASRFDSKYAYHYELAIPLKLLKLQANTPFKYQIMINGGDNKYVVRGGRQLITGGMSASGVAMTAAEIETANNAMNNVANVKYATLDFTGEYTLATKP